MTYPTAPRSEQVDIYHGKPVRDPFRPLEDIESNETRAWIAAQRALTEEHLNRIDFREPIRDRLTERWSFDEVGLPVKRGGKHFYVKRPHLYVRDEHREEKKLLENVLQEWSVSDDGRFLAFGSSESGSDLQTWSVMEVGTRQLVDDQLEGIKFPSISWSPDGKGLFYNRFSPQSGVFFHEIGSYQADDALIYERTGSMFSTRITDDGSYLVISVADGADSRRGIVLHRIGATEAVQLFPPLEAKYDFVGNDGDRFWFLTTNSAPKGRVVEVEIGSPHPSAWKELVPEDKDTLRRAVWAAGKFYLLYLVDAASQIRVHTAVGDFEREVDLPGLGTVSDMDGREEIIFSFSSFTMPPTIFANETVFHAPKVAAGEFETKRVFYASKDGTQVPMFISHKRGIDLNGRNPVYLTGYGGFGEHRSPMFSPPASVWVEMGGVYALACVRGGGEYGEKWHDAGRGRLKQNSFDDFIAAAEWLVESGYTSPSRLAIGGGSNGGLLAAAALIQRPELFGAVVITSGVLDMLRFSEFTVGWAWTSDYGSPSDPNDFETLLHYSPLHNLEPGERYPATLIVTGDHDDRVWPGHSFKFAASMQEAQAGEAPVLIRIESKAGHGRRKPTSRLVDEHADVWSFVADSLGWVP